MSTLTSSKSCARRRCQALDIFLRLKLWNELAVYIINYYYHLLTTEERAAHQNIMHKWKMGQYSDLEMKKRREAAVSTDPKVTALLADGIETFGARLSDRVLREHCDDVFLLPSLWVVDENTNSQAMSKVFLFLARRCLTSAWSGLAMSGLLR